MRDAQATTLDSSDAELIRAVRAGDTSAYAVLFQRHVQAATRLARQLLTTGEADDLVSEAFLKVLAVLQDGRGPDEAFRAYLLTSVRRLHLDRVRATARTRPTDDDAVLDRGVPFEDAVSIAFENDAAARAFASLPERWQLVLWHVEVEGQKPAAVAPLLGMSPNAVSALAYRAREGLRAAYLESHAATATDDACRRVTPLLGGYVRQTLSPRDTAKVDEHLDGCRRCTGVHLELVEVNQNLRGLLAPAVLGPAAAGYLGATGMAATAIAGAGSLAAGSAMASAGSAAASGTAASSVAAGGGFVAAGGYAGASMLTSAVVAQVARVALVPAQAAAATAATVGTPAVVATTVVTGALTTGVVVGGTDLVRPDQPSVVASASPTPTPSPEPGTAPPVVATPAPEPSQEAAGSSDPAPVEEPTTAPTTAPTTGTDEVEPTPGPEPTAGTAPVPGESAGPEPSPSPTAEPTPTPPPVTPTDFGLGTPSITNDSTYLQRRIIVPITADGGGNPVERTVTISIAFDRFATFRGVPGGGWTCDASRNDRITALSCSRLMPAGQGGTFPFKVAGAAPAGTLRITAPEDPHADNDTVRFSSGSWILPL